ncbi:MAG: hypothetical protein K5848_07875 [Lachnospiraceae bacterium]|nr:hypothetical protein [Lachnospiraceae bacterium]
MKSYKEMADSVFDRAERYECEKRRKREHMRRVVAPAALSCAVVAGAVWVGVGMFDSENGKQSKLSGSSVPKITENVAFSGDDNPLNVDPNAVEDVQNSSASSSVTDTNGNDASGKNSGCTQTLPDGWNEEEQSSYCDTDKMTCLNDYVEFTNYTVQPDGVSYTVKLKDGIRFEAKDCFHTESFSHTIVEGLYDGEWDNVDRHLPPVLSYSVSNYPKYITDEEVIIKYPWANVGTLPEGHYRLVTVVHPMIKGDSVDYSKDEYYISFEFDV